MGGELAGLVRRGGGEPYSVPAVREVAVDARDEVARRIDRLSAGEYQAAVFLTGVGVDAMAREADRLGRRDELLAGLRRVTTACRGPKPVGALRRLGVETDLTAAEPHTTRELLDAMAALDLAGARVLLVHYGERSAALADALLARGADLDELCLYEWRMPEDTVALERLARDVVDGRLDAVAFTSQVQFTHLLRAAEACGIAAPLVDALNTKTVVASIGPTCTAALEAAGVRPHVVPEHPKMGHLVAALARHLASASPDTP
jgi:uroporphyrinogen-III synthase